MPGCCSFGSESALYECFIQDALKIASELPQPYFHSSLAATSLSNPLDTWALFRATSLSPSSASTSPVGAIRHRFEGLLHRAQQHLDRTVYLQDFFSDAVDLRLKTLLVITTMPSVCLPPFGLQPVGILGISSDMDSVINEIMQLPDATVVAQVDCIPLSVASLRTLLDRVSK